MQVSMTESGNPKNAQAERINNTMKNELLKDKVFTNISDAIAAVAVDFYNNRRPHMSIGMSVQEDMVDAVGDRNMRWTSYRMNAIKNRDNLDITEKSLPLDHCLGSPSGLRPPIDPRQ